MTGLFSKVLEGLKNKFSYEVIDTSDQHYYLYAEMIGRKAITYEEHKRNERKKEVLRKLENIRRRTQ